MKKSLCLVVAAILLCACKGDSGGGSAAPDVTNVQEGTGTQLNIATMDSAQKAELAGLVKLIVENSEGATRGNISFLNTEILEALCSSGSYSREYQPMMKGVGLSDEPVSVSGSVSATKTASDSAITKTDLTGIFSDYTSDIYNNNGFIKFTGNTTLYTEVTFSKGFSALCSTKDISDSDQLSAVGGSRLDRYTGSLSLSDGIGGAVAYDVTVKLVGDASKTTEATASGAATFKSGGTTIVCSVSIDNTPSVNMDDYKFTCE